MIHEHEPAAHEFVLWHIHTFMSWPGLAEVANKKISFCGAGWQYICSQKSFQTKAGSLLLPMTSWRGWELNLCSNSGICNSKAHKQTKLSYNNRHKLYLYQYINIKIYQYIVIFISHPATFAQLPKAGGIFSSPWKLLRRTKYICIYYIIFIYWRYMCRI